MKTTLVTAMTTKQVFDTESKKKLVIHTIQPGYEGLNNDKVIRAFRIVEDGGVVRPATEAETNHFERLMCEWSVYSVEAHPVLGHVSFRR